MASEADLSPDQAPSLIEQLIVDATNRGATFVPLILSLSSASAPDEASNQADPVVLLITNDVDKIGRPPASKASIDALEVVEIDVEGDRCSVCLDDWKIGDKAAKMPCGHIFRGECLETWLRSHGLCPVCRHEMPVEENEDCDKKTGDGESRRGIRVGILLSLTDSTSRNSSSGSPDTDQETQQG